MNIAIVDDVKEERDRLKSCLEQYAEENSLRYDIRMFENAEELIKNYHPLQYSVIFFDIYMPGMSGTDAAEIIRKDDTDTVLVFLTESMDHMPEAFSLHAYDYIRKPADIDRITKLMNDIMRQNAESKKALTFIYDRDNMSIPFTDIVALCSSGHYLDITDKTGKVYTTRMTFANAEMKLKGETRFLLINRGITVNMDYIQEFKGGSCLLKGGISMPANVRNAKSIEETWHNYLFSKIRNKSMERSAR